MFLACRKFSWKKYKSQKCRETLDLSRDFLIRKSLLKLKIRKSLLKPKFLKISGIFNFSNSIFCVMKTDFSSSFYLFDPVCTSSIPENHLEHPCVGVGSPGRCRYKKSFTVQKILFFCVNTTFWTLRLVHPLSVAVRSTPNSRGDRSILVRGRLKI